MIYAIWLFLGPATNHSRQEFSGYCWFWLFQGETGLFTYISSIQLINAFFNSKTISRILMSFYSLQSINTSYIPSHKKYNTHQTQTIKTLAY